MLLELIKRAIAFISGQKSAVAALQAQLEERDNIINALRRQDVVEDAQLEEANAKAAALGITLAGLEIAGNELANAINENPDTPIVSFGFEVLHDNGATSEPIPAPEPEAPAETTPEAEPETPAPDSVGEKEAAE